MFEVYPKVQSLRVSERHFIINTDYHVLFIDHFQNDYLKMM